jgi:hypothetical protein
MSQLRRHRPTSQGHSLRDALAASLPALAAALLLTAALQIAMGRQLWCECGQAFLWSGDVWSRHNSQHLLDAYSFSHVQHGILFYAAMIAAVRIGRWSRASTIRLRFAAAMFVEAAWEVIENTPFVIERYREQTISLEYYGDTVLNSAADIVACATGYLAAALLPAWSSVAVLAGIEILMLSTIRDSLLVNVLMLLSPVESIRDWQLRGS